ncbi:MAG: hypothetical protein AABM66_12165 [Actinomycetota bacterium]
MARLKRLAVQVIAPIPAFDTTVQAVILLAAILVGGTALGHEVSLAGGIALIAGALFLLTARVAWALQGRLDSIGETSPKVEFAGPWDKVEFILSGDPGGGAGEWAEFVGFHVRNVGGAVAKNLWVEIELHPAGGPPRKFPGRWSQNPRARLGDSFEAAKFTRIDLPPTAQPESVDVAVRFSDGTVFGMNTRNLFSGGRHDIFALPGPEFEVHARVRGEGVDLVGSWRCTNDFKLIPAPGGG